MLGVILICSLTPYNDYVVNNTPMVGSYLPIGLLLFYFVLIVLINGPLHIFVPRWRLDGPELAVALSR